MDPLKKIVIVGGGTAGWIAAAVLSHQLHPDMCTVELVESDEIGTIGVGESTIPPFIALIRNLGIDEAHFIRETQASFKLGIYFSDWKQKGETYFHPFGVIGKRFDLHEFYQCWLKSKHQGSSYELLDFAPANIMAKYNRFFLPEKAQKTPIGGAAYAMHIDAKLAAEYLRKYSEERRVVRTEGMVNEIVQDERGFIKKLVLRDGREIEGDFFIDCTGFRALLIEKTLGAGYRDWSNYLPCDRAIAVQTENLGATVPYTRATARDAGWSWRIPLQHRTGNGYVYSSKFCSDEEARATLLSTIDGEMITEPRVIPFKTGVREEIWKHNCLSLGLASGFIEPLESTAIHLVARGMDFFLRFFPDRECAPAHIKEYNRRMIADYEEIRDFIVLHYATTEREDTPFWRWCKNMELPTSLHERIELFKAHGVLREGNDELFRSASWQSVFEGMGIRPKNYCPRVDNLDYAAVQITMKQAAEMIEDIVLKLPTHDEFLREHCPAEKVEFKKMMAS